jgi:hypothetical protein
MINGNLPLFSAIDNVVATALAEPQLNQQMILSFIALLSLPLLAKSYLLIVDVYQRHNH